MTDYDEMIPLNLQIKFNRKFLRSNDDPDLTWRDIAKAEAIRMIDEMGEPPLDATP